MCECLCVSLPQREKYRNNNIAANRKDREGERVMRQVMTAVQKYTLGRSHDFSELCLSLCMCEGREREKKGGREREREEGREGERE